MNAFRIAHKLQTHFIGYQNLYFQFIPCIRCPLKSKVYTLTIYRLHAVRFGHGELKVQSKMKGKTKTTWLINRVSICDLPCHGKAHMAFMRAAYQMPKSRSTLYAKSTYERTNSVLLFRLSTLYDISHFIFCVPCFSASIRM